MNLILFILVSVSVTNIITSEFIFEKPREWWMKLFGWNEKLKYLITCPICLGFWVGLALSFPFGIEWYIAPFITSIMAKLLVLYENRQ